MKYRIGIPTGGVIDEVGIKDHIVGSVGVGLKSYPQLLHSILDGDQYYSMFELQASGNIGETNTCTNQSLMRITQWFVNYYYKNNLLAKETREFLEDNGFIINGECNLSESWFAIMSGTDPNRGNSLVANCRTWDNFGCVPESKHPDDFSSVARFWRKSTQEMLDLGAEFRKHFDIDYAWLWNGVTQYAKKGLDALEKHLLEGRIYSAIPVCSPWDAVVEFTGRTQSDHAVDISGRENIKDTTDIKDSYIPFSKKLVNRYVINAAMKVVIFPLKKKEDFT